MFKGPGREPLGQMRLSSAEFIEKAPLNDLRHVLSVRNKPVRDKITWKYDFDPTTDGVRHYIDGANANDFAGKKAVGNEAAKDLIGRKRRSKWHIVDSVERNMWAGSAIARQRLTALDIMASSVASGAVFNDRYVQVNASDAIEDFGFSLLGDDSKPAEQVKYTDGDLGTDIAHIGIELADNPELFLAQGALIDVVADEQHRRIKFFQSRLDATIEVYGNKLRKTDTEAENDLQNLLAIWNKTSRV